VNLHQFNQHCIRFGIELRISAQMTTATQRWFSIRRMLSMQQGDLSGEILAGRYQIIQKIGQGGMGAVYKALDTRLQKIVAVKFLKPVDEESEQGFQNARVEAKRLQSFRSPHVLPTLDFGKAEGRTYLILEYVEGRSLAEMIAGGEPIELRFAIGIVSQVAQALVAAHQNQIVHCDVKPSNILISNDGIAQLSDFELAIGPGGLQRAEAGIAGTPGYMSPEQAMGNSIDARSDIFSLSVVLYEVLTGVRPFSGASSAETLRNVVEYSPVSPEQINPIVPAGLAAVVMKGLAKQPAKRFQTMTSFLAALEKILPSIPRTNPALVTRMPQSSLPNEVSTATGLRPYEPGLSSEEVSKQPASAIAWLLLIGAEGRSSDERPHKIRLVDSITIGRESDNDVVFFDYEVWHHHASIALEHGRFYITDLNSSRGTFVNGVRIEKSALQDRDQIQIGERILLFIQAVSPKELNVEAQRRLQDFEAVWDQLTRSARHV
jgi:serine/threonine protein kinase